MAIPARVLKRLESLETAISLSTHPDITRDGHSIRLNNAPGGQDLFYHATGTLNEFHQKRDKDIRIIVGPFGSGKSSACCAEIVHCACEMPPLKTGIRSSKWAIIRNTMGELESTTLRTWLSWFRYLGVEKHTKKPILTYSYQFNDGKGIVELELIFLGLDREDNKKKLESLEITGAYINEMQHVPQGIYTHLLGRVGRYPFPKDMDQEFYSPVIADTNPPDETHWLPKMENTHIPGVYFHHQPPGLIKNDDDEWMDNPQADNYENLSRTKPNYYFNMAKYNGFNSEFIKVYTRGEYGLLMHGKVVFPMYNDDLHSTKELDFIKDEPVLLIFDYGMTPCCLIAQFVEGQYRLIKEFVTERSSVLSLVEDRVQPFLDANLDGYELQCIGDPSGKAAKETDGLSCEEIIAGCGLPITSAKTNDLQPRLDAVKYFLNRLTEGQAAFILSRDGCPTLREAFLREYCYRTIKVVGEEKTHDVPNKTHPWSDIMDCCEYGACEFSGSGSRFFNKQKFDYSIFINTERF